jgi:hypothetical protein
LLTDPFIPPQTLLQLPRICFLSGETNNHAILMA